MSINVELLEKIKEVIKEKPDELRMHYWYSDLHDEDFRVCGTAYCIGGWACYLSGEDPKESPSCEIMASRILGLSYGQAIKLFDQSKWNKEYEGLGVNEAALLTIDDLIKDPENFAAVDLFNGIL